MIPLPEVRDSVQIPLGCLLPPTCRAAEIEALGVVGEDGFGVETARSTCGGIHDEGNNSFSLSNVAPGRGFLRFGSFRRRPDTPPMH